MNTPIASPALCELETFKYYVSHDLRAPLRHVLGYISLLQERPAVAQDEEARTYVDRTLQAVSRLERLVDSMLEFSRAGRISMHYAWVSMTQMVKQLQREFQADIGARVVTWQIGRLPNAFGDELMLQQVWQNLIANALKYTQPRSAAHIEIGAMRSAAELIYYVKDNGVGFDPRDAKKLFCDFERLHSASEFEGIGVGLANVRRIVESHRGGVWAVGEPNRGAAFFFSLPPQGL